MKTIKIELEVPNPRKTYSYDYDWPDIFPDGTQLAMDADGDWYFYSKNEKAVVGTITWVNDYDGATYYKSISKIIPLPPLPKVPLSDWKNSQIVKGAK